MAGAEWSDKRIGTLTRMAADHHTAAEVAVQLGISRSAVLGKAKRLGVSFNGRQAPAPVPHVVMPSGARLILVPDEGQGEPEAVAVAPVASAPEPEPEAQAAPPVAPQEASPEQDPEPKPVPVPAVAAEPVRPTPKGWPKPAGPHAVALEDLRDHHCRMPLFGPLQRTGLFCGEPVERPGGSWCAGCRPLIREGRPALSGEAAEAMRARFTRQSSSGAFA